MELRVTSGNRREVMKNGTEPEDKREGRLYRIIIELLIGLDCALAATFTYVLLEKFM